MIVLTEINGKNIRCCPMTTILLPSDFLIVLDLITDKNGDIVEITDEDGNLMTEFYFEFFVKGEENCKYICAAIRRNGRYELINAAIEKGKIVLIFDHEKYNFHDEGKLCYRQKGRISTKYTLDGYFDVWAEDELPVFLKKMKK